MMTVKQVSRLTGLSARALRYYDAIGLLAPGQHSPSGYRLYGDADLERLSQILFFRELKFPLKEIRRILASPDFDRGKALAQQIELLELEQERLTALIAHAKELQNKEGGIPMDFSVFDREKQRAYAQQAKKQWGSTAAWAEYEEKTAQLSQAETDAAGAGLMELFQAFGRQLAEGQTPESPAAQAQVKTLQDYISQHYYTCTREILSGLGQMYAAGGEMTENIDRAGGAGTAAFAAQAIAVYCR